MSGPKVVRIVTHEELVAICRGLLAALDSAFTEWERVGRRNESVSDADVRAFDHRRGELRALLRANRLTELQKAVPDEIAFLAHDQDARLAQAAAVRAAERTAQRRLGGIAAAVLQRLDEAELEVTDELRARLGEMVEGRANDSAALRRAFALLESQAGREVTTDHQRRLAQKLREGAARETIEEWIRAQPDAAHEDDLVRLDRRLAELAVLLGEPVAASFEERLGRIARIAPSRRPLLVDSLEADLAVAVRDARTRTELQRRLRLLAAELTETGDAGLAQLATEILGSLDAGNSELAAHEASAVAAVNSYREEAAAHARRNAVLAGLSALGYQVSGEMETAWVENGRLMVRKPTQPGYGVEIGGGANAARLQVRTVAFRSAAAPPDTARDSDAETLWCADLGRLKEEFAASGNAIEIERSTPVGAVPLKAVGDTSTEVQTHSEVRPRERLRSLDGR